MCLPETLDVWAVLTDKPLVAAFLQTLVSVVGNQTHPVMNLAYVGVTFTGSRIQYFDPHGVPSGGDWALQRDAALFFEGTENVNVTGCTIERVDGNGLMLSGYTRGAVVAQNEFVWIGDTAMATWGYTKEIDRKSVV